EIPLIKVVLLDCILNVGDYLGVNCRRLYQLGRMMELKGTRRAIFLRVHVNFGQKKFAFDVKEYEAQERLKQQMTIEKISLPPNISYG
ncbi:hypothetical protein ES332_D10G221400v1, partial [Gossypium tomentosum]